jgi:16S rRNA (cytidine1402-2'-O)-methyltransferase
MTNIFFESAKRISKTIEIFSEVLSSDTQIVICREMTKEHESIYRGSLEEILTLVKTNKIKFLGEFALLIHPSKSHSKDFDLDENFCKPFLDYLSPTDASKLIAKITNFSKQDIYRFFIEISK